MNASEQAYPFMAAIPKGWTIKRFGEVLAEPRRNGIYKTKEFHGRGQKIINMGELFAYDFISNQEMKRVELTSKELEKSLVQDGDLLFARRSLVLEGSGKCSLVVRPSEDTTFESSIIRARLNKNESEPKFYYYLFRSPLGRALMSSIATRTAVSGITGSNLVQLRVPCPPLFIQRKIAAILSAYDDLIENNRRRIEILEEMARSLYREWFVNFRFPGHEQVKMVDSEWGLIPEGWGIVPIGKIAKVKGGKRLPKGKSVQDEKTNYPYIRVKDMKDFSLDISDIKYIDEEAYKVIQRYIIYSQDIYISIAGTIGRVGIVPKSLSGANLTENAAKICEINSINKYVLFCYLCTPEGQAQIASKVVGTSQPKLALFRIEEIKIFLPPSNLQAKAVLILSSYYEQIENLTLKNTNLRKTRDLLLPKLISGEIDVENLDINTGPIAA